jgi:hypothetical protein
MVERQWLNEASTDARHLFASWLAKNDIRHRSKKGDRNN